ncbi:SNF2 family N-terminal domain-containing protein [Chaetomium sp. MPI-CAGE-AT-0009]|nr:SNF2 family N-terminal domain-containing protein [Chaetomium sp. MPI-CAGE-AT-0009]
MEDLTDSPKHPFSFMQRQLPPGRRIQVSEVMKRFLRTNFAHNLQRSAEEDEEESEIGQSDDEQSVDSETWREYQQEEAERAAMEARKESPNDRLLSKEEVTEAVHIAIQELESRWVAEKKPKCDLKARKIWQDARRNPDRVAFIDLAKRELDHFVRRIALYSKHIIDQPWTVGNNVQKKASGYLEATVFDKKRQTWLIDVVESPLQPPRPSTLPRPAPRRAKQTSVEDDEEVLTSDSDDMDAFIEYDDNAIPLVNDDMDIDSEPLRDGAAAQTSSRRSASATPDGGAGASPSLARTTPSEQPDDVEKALVPVTPLQTGTSAREVIVIDSSPASPLENLEQVPGLDDFESLEKIREAGLDRWEKARDAERLVVAVVSEWSQERIAKVYGEIKDSDHTEIWAQYMAPTLDAHEDPSITTAGLVGFCLCRLFDVFATISAKRISRRTLRLTTRKRLERLGDSFAGFCTFLKRILPLLLGLAPQTPTRIVLKTPQKGGPSTPTPPRRSREPTDGPGTTEESSSDDMTVPSTKKRRRRKRRDANAHNLRVGNVKRNEEFERRTRELREKLAQHGSVSSKHARLIVNETKESDDQALIYINDHIGSKIKDHQIDGVRFMWNQVVVESSLRQGCLLAHTMGLGKTMQVITLLVVIAESSASPDESKRSQIPESLRESRTLVLCPPSLVDNWQDEIRMWAPDEVLGPVHRLEPGALPPARTALIRTWVASGGVLILGYSMFTILVQGDADMAKLLHETPNIVIGDEAHYMKNPHSQRHQATAQFKTMNRIAMTGSPLTNNVMDYYAMINWVAPNYLADIGEFRDRFSNPIKEGLYADSEPHKKRKARRMLHVLKETVGPKVHRRDIEVLLNELPKKKEFIITLPLAKVQMQLYRRYIECITDPSREVATGQARAWSLVATLVLVLAHPLVFKTVAETRKAKPGSGKGKSSRPGNPEDNDDMLRDIPQDVLSEMLPIVAIREIEDYALSNKILVLLQILDECRKAGDKVLVFSQSIPTLDYIENIFKRKRVTRQDSVKKFNTDSESQVYLVSSRAGGVGLNIYGANRVIIFDFKYSPTDEQQAIGRAYRLGQTKPVYVYWLTVGGTFEDTIHNNAVFKTQLAKRVVDKKNPDPWSTRFSDYFKMPREVDQEDLSGSFGQDKVLDSLLENEEISRLIRKITSTETFEREETYELTPEEKLQAEKDIEIERLRSRNPEEFKRREQELSLRSPQPPFGLYQPYYIDGETVLRIKVPEHMRERRKSGLPASPVVLGTASSDRTPSSFRAEEGSTQQQVLTLTSDTALVGRAVPPTPRPPTFMPPALAPPPPAQGDPAMTQAIPTPSLATVNDALAQEPTPAPQPILATGTHFKVPQTPPPAAEAAPNGASKVSGSDFPDLLAAHSALCREGRHSVWNRSRIEQLPMMDKIQNMKKCTRNARFAEAMLSGLEMEEISATLNGLAEGEFKQRVWTTKADLNQMRTDLTAKAGAERRRTGELGEGKEGANRRALRFLGSGPEPEDPATPQNQNRRRAVNPGDSADSPQVID